jgi:ABC-type transport system involved in multi-copper enzyme maturation permease subunit
VGSLSYRDLWQCVALVIQLSLRIVFHRKLVFAALGVLGYYAVLYAIMTFNPSDGFTVEDALNVLVQVPMAALAIYLSMDIVASERDRDTLETLFSTASSHYVIWMVRLTSLHGILLVSALLMSSLSYVLFAEFPFVLGGLNTVVPAYLVANLTFYFAVSVRSSNAAGMLSLGCLLMVLMFSSSISGTVYDPLLNPFNVPDGFDLTLWEDRVLINRASVVGAGGLMLYLGLRKMERRERLLT